MAHFRDAYEQLTPKDMLLNSHGPGEATFEVYWTADPTYQHAELRFVLDGAPNVVRQYKFEGWQVDVDAARVGQHMSENGFNIDDWNAVPADH